MQICDKIKEMNELYTEFGECYRLLNEEIVKGNNMNTAKVSELFEKKKKIWNKRTKVAEEVDVLVGKLNADWKVIFDKYLKES